MIASINKERLSRQSNQNIDENQPLSQIDNEIDDLFKEVEGDGLDDFVVDSDNYPLPENLYKKDELDSFEKPEHMDPVSFAGDPDIVLNRLKKLWIELRVQFLDYLSILPVFGFNSSRYDLNLIKEFLIPFLVNDRKTNPSVVKRTNQIVSLKFDNIQFLDILNFLGGCTSLDKFLLAYKTEEKRIIVSLMNQSN